ncbi:alpha/beta fold hydrolase [Kitasatospora sp. NPDC006697]|uniref:alpha/beta fold hydrolase n=1 Tax=Kitasatospora sp. NPDC006697 TaxID=3364020 RepID=UPI0036A66D7A
MTRPDATDGMLRVDGATLFHQVRGQGPLLLLIPGGTGGAAAFDGIADRLAAEYTVAAYDPRGLGRSPLDDPAAHQRVAQHAEDARRLLDHLSPGAPARVFGASSGAIVGLRLLTAHPDRVARLVAHEPPLVEVLPDAPVHRALLARVRELDASHGAAAALAAFAAGISGTEPPEPVRSEVELPPGMEYFIGRIVPSFMAHVPDLDRLAALADRLVLAAGEEYDGELLARPAALMARQLGRKLHHFPGGHIGLTTHPEAFGAALRRALGPPRP